MGVSGENSSEGSKKGQQRKKGGVNVLPPIFVTATVFHFERSALNATAQLNAVGENQENRKKNNGNEWTEFK
jgi:hypothetical protein